MWIAIKSFVLLITAMLGIVIAFTISPVERVYYGMAGKTRGELDEAIKKLFESKSDGTHVKNGCLVGGHIILAFAYTFLITPLVTLGAIVNHTGNQNLAYIILLIILASWVTFYRQLRTKINPESIVRVPNKVIRTGRKVLFAVPEIYLLYVFLIVIGILM